MILAVVSVVIEGWLGGDFGVAFMEILGVVCGCDFWSCFGCGFACDFGVVFLGVVLGSVLGPDLGLRGGGFGGLFIPPIDRPTNSPTCERCGLSLKSSFGLSPQRSQIGRLAAQL